MDEPDLDGEGVGSVGDGIIIMLAELENEMLEPVIEHVITALSEQTDHHSLIIAEYGARWLVLEMQP